MALGQAEAAFFFYPELKVVRRLHPFFLSSGRKWWQRAELKKEDKSRQWEPSGIGGITGPG